MIDPKRIAADAVQRLADSEPDEDAIAAMDRLAGTPQESMFCVSAPALEWVIEVAIADALFDASRASLLARHRDGERDTKRLDWLERAVPSLEFRDFCNGLSTPWPGTFREFVDAAMSAGPSPERASPPVNADDSRGHKSTSPCEKCGAMEVYVSQSDADDADFTIHCYACGMHYRVDGPDA